MKARDAWEKEFQRHYLTMVFKDAENIINKARNVMVNAGNMTEKPLERWARLSCFFDINRYHKSLVGKKNPSLDLSLERVVVKWKSSVLY